VSSAAPLLAALLLLAPGCTQPLPEPESAAARLYAERCQGCHGLFAPHSMTAAMWQFQVGRMQGEMVRRGVAPLNPDEMKTILDYLARHSAGHERQP